MHGGASVGSGGWQLGKSSGGGVGDWAGGRGAGPHQRGGRESIPGGEQHGLELMNSFGIWGFPLLQSLGPSGGQACVPHPMGQVIGGWLCPLPPAASWQCECSLGLPGRSEVAEGNEPALGSRGRVSGFGCDPGKSLNCSEAHFSQQQNGDDAVYPQDCGKVR